MKSEINNVDPGSSLEKNLAPQYLTKTLIISCRSEIEGYKLGQYNKLKFFLKNKLKQIAIKFEKICFAYLAGKTMSKFIS